MPRIASASVESATICGFVNSSQFIVQIVPYPLPCRGGVNDYAQVLAKRLKDAHGVSTHFLTGDSLKDANWHPSPALAGVLHYVNYGYDSRGIPFWLPKRISELRKAFGTPVTTIFHELYAAGSWNRSAFWLQPLQKRLARLLAQSSVMSIVSSNLVAGQLRKLLPSAPILVRPVLSTFGEPTLSPDQIASRDSKRWVIAGGTELVQRSLDSVPRGKDLCVIGGDDRNEIRRELAPGRYFPNVEAEVASQHLMTCAYGWVDYFAQADVATEAILKSTTFAAYCAHGVIPVLPSVNSKISLDGDVMPGPFTPATLPAANERPAIAKDIYEWYRRNASSDGLATRIAEMIRR